MRGPELSTYGNTDDRPRQTFIPGLSIRLQNYEAGQHNAGASCLWPSFLRAQGGGIILSYTISTPVLLGISWQEANFTFRMI